MESHNVIATKQMHSQYHSMVFILPYRHLQSNGLHSTSTGKIQFEDTLHGTGPTNSWVNADTLRFCYFIDFP